MSGVGQKAKYSDSAWLFRFTPESGLSALVGIALSGDQVMARAVVTPRPPMLRAIRTSSNSPTICRPWSE